MQPDRHITGVSFAILLLVAVITQPTAAALAQGSRRDLQEDATNVTVDPLLFEGLEYRSSGFARGGRSTAVTGVAGDPLTYYFGSTGGGVWKTSDAGNNWNNISDGFFGVGAIGAIAVAPSDPNVLYAGTGSGCPRGNISNGDGIYRSTDAGRTWSHIGLDHAGQIPKIRVHPDNPDVVYVAALGHIFGPNEDRGVFRSTDGGDTWDKVLYIDDATGFNQVAMDVNNPRILYAAAWRVERKPWTLISGNDNGGIWKSTDGGDTWTQLAGGLPTGLVGKIDVTVSAANSDRLWALIEAEGERGGVYRSDDAGDSWSRINSAANLRQRPWYYTHIYADPKDENTVYALNTGLYRSIDGGVGFDQQIDVPHGDNHDLWINPGSPQIMINANDGGANVSFNGGESWSSQMNQPTAEIYRVFVDDDWPYRIYGPQQDNSTISIPSFTGRNRVFPDWFAVGGCESGHIAIDPRDNSVVYAGCYGGAISRLDRDAGSSRQVLAYPQLQLGQAPRDLEYRFQWNAPIRISPHDPDVVYHTSQVVHRTGDGGQSWEVISPDLTTDNPETQDYAGGPISHDSTGVEVYNTIFAFEESPHTAGLLWAGSDDGKIHLSRNNGGSWTDITPDDMPPGGTVNVIDLSAHDPGRAHVAVYRYREGDFRPYIFQTSDYGDSWRLLTAGDNGIPATNFVRAVREDPEQQGLLFAGTEYGMYASFDDGSHWQELQLNLPVTPVTDLRVHRGDLVVSTQGRGFWVLDDMTMLRQADEAMAVSGSYLFAPRKAYRVGNFGPTRIRYYLAEETESEETDGEVTLTILDADGEILEEVTGSPGEDDAQQSGAGGFFAPLGSGPATLTAEPGLNTFTWRLREEAPDVPDDVTLWGIAPGRPVLPGTYTVQLSRGDWSQEQQIVVGINPKPGVTAEDLRLQHEFLGEVGDAIGEMYDGLRRLRDIKKQGAEVVAQMDRAGIDNEEITAAQKAMAEKLTAIEEQITQVKSRSSQDPLNFPPMLDNQIINVYGYALGGFGGGDNRPTDGAHERFEDLKPQLASLMSQLQEIVDTDLDAFNAMVESADVPAVVVSQ